MRNPSNRRLLQHARSIAHRLYEAGGEPPEVPLRQSPLEQSPRVPEALAAVRAVTAGTPFEHCLWIVGGYVRDRALGLHDMGDDVDIVTEADAVEVAELLHSRGIAQIAPVVYPRFGTAMVRVAGCNVELVTARRESYASASRKPDHVAPATLEDDAMRRDFTVNTLLENLHSGEQRDPTGHGMADLRARCLRTPDAPGATFADDPLRMLRAVRFAGKLGFTIAPQTWDAMVIHAHRLGPPKVSFERIQAEFAKMLMTATPSQCLEMLRRSHLLERFAPELCETVGVTQNEFHSLPVWDHTLLALDNLVAEDPATPLTVRLAALFHDIGKPRTRSVGPDGRVHFYHHEEVGSKITRTVLTRMKFSGNQVETAAMLVAQHMRIGEYKPEQWSDAAVRRLVRDAGERLGDLFDLHRADVSALARGHTDASRSVALRSRIERLEAAQPSRTIDSPLSGDEIMAAVDLAAGPAIGRWKLWLLSEVLEGRLDAHDKVAATAALQAEAARRAAESPADRSA